MCGRFGFSSSLERAARRFGARLADGTAALPRFNIAPTQPILAILNTAGKDVAALRWGLVPAWAPSPAEHKLTTFNARIETLATARAYREPLRFKRCAIFADYYYEWQSHAQGAKTPMLIRRRDGEPFCFAGVWDSWRRGGEELHSCTIVTQPPNELVRPIHSRMPVVLHDATLPTWLGAGERDPATMLALLEPQAPAAWEAYAVSPRVGNARNDDASLIARLES